MIISDLRKEGYTPSSVFLIANYLERVVMMDMETGRDIFERAVADQPLACCECHDAIWPGDEYSRSLMGWKEDIVVNTCLGCTAIWEDWAILSMCLDVFCKMPLHRSLSLVLKEYKRRTGICIQFPPVSQKQLRLFIPSSGGENHEKGSSIFDIQG